MTDSIAVKAAIARALEFAPLVPGWNSGAVNVAGRWFICRAYLSPSGNPRWDLFPMVTETRKLSGRERKILDRMFAQLPHGGHELHKQLKSAMVSDIDDDGSIRFLLNSANPVSCIAERVPVTAIFDDKDGVPIYLLLHVVEGRLWELEVYKADGSQMIEAPAPDHLYF